MRKWIFLSLMVLALDQFTKYAVLANFTPGETRPILPFFSLILTFNTGAAFSFLADAGGWQRPLFIGLALAASVWIVFLLRKYWRNTLFSLALSLILGGALGNVIDRIVAGKVTDFLLFYYDRFSWPAFNLADTAITIGAVLLVWESFTKPDQK